MESARPRLLSPALVLALGTVFWNLSGRERDLNQIYPMPKRFYLLLTFIGLTGFVIGICWLGNSLFKWINEKQKAVFGIRNRHSHIYHASYADKSDLAELCRLYKDAFPANAPELSSMVAWHIRNPTIFIKVLETTKVTNTSVIAGSAKIFPLKKRAISLLENERIAGDRIPTSDITKPGGRPACLYLGDVVAFEDCRDILASAVVKQLRRLASPTTPIYMRPLSPDGMHYATEYEFAPVNGEGGIGRIYRLEGAKAFAILSQLRSAGGLEERKRNRPRRGPRETIV